MILRGRRTRGVRRFDRWSPEILAGVRPQFHRLRRPVMGLGPLNGPGADDLRMTSFVHTFLLSSISLHRAQTNHANSAAPSAPWDGQVCPQPPSGGSLAPRMRSEEHTSEL